MCQPASATICIEAGGNVVRGSRARVESFESPNRAQPRPASTRMTAVDESRFAAETRERLVTGLYRSLGRKFVTGCKGSAARAQTVWERAFGPSWTHCRFPRPLRGDLPGPATGYERLLACPLATGSCRRPVSAVRGFLIAGLLCFCHRKFSAAAVKGGSLSVMEAFRRGA